MSPLSNPPDVAAAIAVHAAISDAHHTQKRVVAGSYTGDGSNDRQITTGFKCGLVLATQTGGLARYRICYPDMTIAVSDGAVKTDLLLHATDGFIVDNSQMNENLETYYYWAFEE